MIEGKYFNGKVCKKHPNANGLRFTSNRKCVHCARRNSKKWLHKHIEEARDRARIYQERTEQAENYYRVVKSVEKPIRIETPIDPWYNPFKVLK